jgi:hypothetical protein
MNPRSEVLAFRPKATQRVETVPYRRAWDDTKAHASRRRGQLAERHAATVAKRLALAHHIAAQIDAGVYDDQADVARQHGLTRARLTQLTQLMNLLLLAPDIQEEILALEVPAEAGANVWLLRPFDDVVYARTRQRAVGEGAAAVDVVTVAAAQAIVDLASAPGRGPQEAEAMLAQMRASADVR